MSVSSSSPGPGRRISSTSKRRQTPSSIPLRVKSNNNTPDSSPSSSQSMLNVYTTDSTKHNILGSDTTTTHVIPARRPLPKPQESRLASMSFLKGTASSMSKSKNVSEVKSSTKLRRNASGQFMSRHANSTNANSTHTNIESHTQSDYKIHHTDHEQLTAKRQVYNQSNSLQIPSTRRSMQSIRKASLQNGVTSTDSSLKVSTVKSASHQNKPDSSDTKLHNESSTESTLSEGIYTDSQPIKLHTREKSNLVSHHSALAESSMSHSARKIQHSRLQLAASSNSHDGHTHSNGKNIGNPNNSTSSRSYLSKSQASLKTSNTEAIDNINRIKRSSDLDEHSISNQKNLSASLTNSFEKQRVFQRRSTLVPFSNSSKPTHKKSPSMSQLSTSQSSSVSSTSPYSLFKRSSPSKDRNDRHLSPSLESRKHASIKKPPDETNEESNEISHDQINSFQKSKSFVVSPPPAKQSHKQDQKELNRKSPLSLLQKPTRRLTMASFPTSLSPPSLPLPSGEVDSLALATQSSPTHNDSGSPILTSMKHQPHVTDSQQTQSNHRSLKAQLNRNINSSTTESLLDTAKRLSRKSAGSLRLSLISKKSSNGNLLSSAALYHNDVDNNSFSPPPMSIRLPHTTATTINKRNNSPSTTLALVISAASSPPSSFSMGSALSTVPPSTLSAKAQSGNHSSSTSSPVNNTKILDTSDNDEFHSPIDELESSVSESNSLSTQGNSKKLITNVGNSSVVSIASTQRSPELNSHSRSVSNNLPSNSATVPASQSNNYASLRDTSDSSRKHTATKSQPFAIETSNPVSIKSPTSTKNRDRFTSPKRISMFSQATSPFRSFNRSEHIYPPHSRKRLESKSGNTAENPDEKHNLKFPVGSKTAMNTLSEGYYRSRVSGKTLGTSTTHGLKSPSQTNSKQRSKSTVSKQWNTLSNSLGSGTAKRLLLSPFSSEHRKMSTAHQSGKIHPDASPNANYSTSFLNNNGDSSPNTDSFRSTIDSITSNFFSKTEKSEAYDYKINHGNNSSNNQTLVRRASYKDVSSSKVPLMLQHKKSFSQQRTQPQIRPNSEADNKEIEKIMRSLISSMPEDEKITKRYEEGKRNGSLVNNPLTPSMAARTYKLNLYEKGEILDFRFVYFCARPDAKKISGDIRHAINNYGFDDKNGDYQVVPGDHIAYRYEVLSVLGKGSFGKVLKCIDHKNGKLVAVKMVINRKRFHLQALIEADILRSLSQWVCSLHLVILFVIN